MGYEAKGNTRTSGATGVQPPVPATNVAATNNTGTNAVVYISGGTVSAIKLGAQVLGIISGTVLVKAGQSITLTYTVAPTWIWFAD